jgi:hypothetical protein
MDEIPLALSRLEPRIIIYYTTAGLEVDSIVGYMTTTLAWPHASSVNPSSSDLNKLKHCRYIKFTKKGTGYEVTIQ